MKHISRTSIYLLIASLLCCTLKSNAQEEKEYRRISLYTLIMDEYPHPYRKMLADFFEKSPLSEKFNNHNLPSRIFQIQENQSLLNKKAHQGNNDMLFTGDGGLKFEKKEITSYLDQNNVARDLVAKWFNRSKKGGFNMELVQSRGNYDASNLNVSIAKATKRGMSSIADAGEELIQKTFVLVYDSHFIYNHQFDIEKAKRNEKNKAYSMFSKMTPIEAEHFIFNIRAHLYQLDWNDEIATQFYSEYWADDKSITAEKKKAFDETTLFKLKYIGSNKSQVIYKKIFHSIKEIEDFEKNKIEILGETTLNAIDEAIVKLQKEHDVFKTKTPLYSIEPITAKIGLKEGVTKKSIFGVVEKQIDENGKTKYVDVGTIKVDPEFPIWDNKYNAGEENPNSTTDRTYFKKVSGSNFYPGMLIVQKKGK
jgi:hypothetical protein